MLVKLRGMWINLMTTSHSFIPIELTLKSELFQIRLRDQSSTMMQQTSELILLAQQEKNALNDEIDRLLTEISRKTKEIEQIEIRMRWAYQLEKAIHDGLDADERTTKL